MATFIVLSSFTEQGIRNIKETTNRAEAFKEMVKKRGATVKDCTGRSGATTLSWCLRLPTMRPRLRL